MKNTRLRKFWFLVGLLFTLTKIGYAQCGPGQDITRPTFEEPYFSLDVYEECEDDVVVTPPTPMDDCTANPTLTIVEDLTTPGSCPNQFIRIINYQAEDEAGNTALYSVSVQVLDLTPPVFDQEPNELNQIVSCEDDLVITAPTATDNCGVEEITVFSTENEQIGDCSFNFNRTVTYRAIDECNNFSFYTIVYTVQDDNAPVFDLEAGALNQTVSCISEIETFEIPTATDDCSEAQVQLLTDETTDGACANSFVRTITYEATDLCGNASQYQVVITVNDEIAPVFSSTPGELDFTYDCADGGEIEIPVPTAIDNCEGNIEMTIVRDETNAGDCAGNSVRTVSYVAVDACGNESEPYLINITIGDTSPPEWITEVNALNAEFSCDEIADLVIPVPEATDLCGNTTVELTTSNNIEMGCAGNSQWVYIYHATDECGNVSDAEFIVTITIVDNVAPSFTDEPGALDITLSCDEVAGFELPVPQAIDNCSETEVVLINDETNASEICLAESVRVLTYQVSDVCGNEGGTYSVTISVFDNVPPSINGLFDENVTAGCGETPSVPLVQVLDNCDSEIELVYAADTTEGNCAGGYIITRTWSATDACGNSTERTQTIAVEDNLMPVITAVPASTVISCGEIPEVGEIQVYDNCDLSPEIVFNENIVEGDCPNNYVIRRVWTVTDDCNNETFAIQELTIQDDEGPVFVDFPANTEISCGAVAGAVTEVVATDDCGGEIIYNMEEVANYDECPYTLTRTWTATDICGNETVQSQIITLTDEEGPVFSNVPLAANVDCNSIPNVGQPTILDNCDDSPQMEMTETTEGEGCPYTIVRTWTAIDKCGNETIATQTITVDDNTGPEIQNVPADITVNCSELQEAPQLIAMDNCAGELATEYSEVTNGEGCDVTIIRTWTATDLCGNASSASQTISVSDDEDPTFNVAFDNPYTVDCGDEIPEIQVVNAIDNCGEATVEFEETSNNGVCENDQTIFRNWTATDACGNVATLQQVITVGDQNPPVFTEAVGEFDVAICAGQIATVSAPNVTDGCSAVELNFNDETIDTDCAGQQLIVRTYTATDACGNNSTYVQNINIYGDITGTISNSGANCEVQLNLDCSGYSTMWSDDAGNTGSGNTYNPTLDASGTVTFFVTNANAPLDCNAESFVFNYDCSNTCPLITSASTSELHICSGSSFELISEVINEDGGTLTWYDAAGNVVADPSNVSITNTTCQEITTIYTAEYVSANDFCETATTETAVVTIYPEISYEVANDGCEIYITNYCEGFNISYVDEYGKPGNDDVYIAEAGGQGTVTFTIFNTDASQAPLSCQFTTITEDFDCGECPALSDPIISANDICSGEFVSLEINVNNGGVGGSIKWYDSNDNLIPNPSKIFLNTENCNGEDFSFYASYNPPGEYCEIVVSDIATVTVYPQIDATVINDGCTVALNNINLCNNEFEIAWSDDSGNSGVGPIYSTADGSTGNVTFIVTNTATNVPDNCATATFVAAYACQTCPVITLDDDIPTAVCYGESIPLSASIAPNTGGTVQWFNDEDVLLNDLTLDDINYNNCDGAVINYYAVFTPSNTDCPPVQTEMATVTIYPAITASAISNGCEVTLNNYCEDFTVTWEDSNGNTGTGDSFTQTSGATGSVTYTVTNPNGYEGCESATFTATANCSSSCPNLYNVECSPPTVCDGEAFSLIVAVSNLDGGTIQWFDENDNLIINTNDIVVEVDACLGGQFGYYAVYTPANASCGSVTSEMAYVMVYPNITAEMTGENSCNVDLINECENLDIEWVDNLGNTGTGSSYTATSGSSGAVTFTVTNPATGVPASCSNESFGPFDYACSNCPLIYSPYCDPPVACEGDPFSLQVLVTDLDGGTIQWFDENDNAIDITDDIVLDINACEGGQFGYYAVYTPLNASCNVVTTEMAYVTIYPSIVGNIQSNGCEVVLEDYCPSFPITWVDGDGNTGVGNTYTAAGPGTGAVTFTVNNPATGAPAHCQTMTFDSDYECIACPEIFNPVCDPPVICAGEGFSLQVGINNLDGGTLQWYDQSGNAIINSEDVVLDIDACAGGQFGYYVEYTPANENCPTVSTELTFVQVYPQINAEVVEAGCSVNLTNTCPNQVISWMDDLGNTGTGINYTGNSGNSGTVTYTVSNPVDGVPSACLSQTYDGAYDCPVCPEIATVSCNPSAICEGETFSLAVVISNLDGGTIQWFSEDGTPIYSTNDIVLDINACAGGQFGYYAEYTPANATCPVTTSELAYVTIYPSINAQIVSDGCNVSVNNYCANFDVAWTDAAGNSGSGDSFSGLNGESGAVTFTVTNPNGIDGCQSNDYTTNYACIDCPTIFNPACSPPVICEGESFGLVVGFNNLDGGVLNWYDEQGNIITNTSDIVLDLNACEGGTFGYYVEYTPNNESCATISTETTYVTVYPQINADIVTGDCQVTVENYCPDFNIAWYDDAGNTGNGDTYLGDGGAGTVSFNITNIGATGNCLSETFNASYNCESTDCPQLGTPSISSNNICSGESVTLSVEVSNPNGGTLTWLDQAGNSVDPTDLVINNNTCETVIHTYYAVYVSGNANCPDVNTATVSVNIYPEISYETETDGCSITITNYCENFWITWIDSEGKSGDGNVFEGNAGESGFVEFTIYNPTAGQIPISCQFEFLTVDYACGNCPSILNPTATPDYACNGETVSLDVTISNDDGGTLQWFDANNNPVADPTNVLVTTTSCGDEIFGYYAVYTPANASCAELTSSSTFVHAYPNITAVTNVEDCEVLLVTSYICEEFEIAWTDDLGGSGTGATYIVQDGTVGTVTYTITNNTPGTPDACATATFMADFDCTKETLFDLALQKTLAAGQSSTVNVGDQVTYTITVYNQGQITAQNITVSDYIPNGLTLNDANWSGTGSTVTTTVAGPILPGDNAMVDVTFTVTATFAGVIRNYAEISYAEDEGGNPQDDFDSFPDSDDSNDGIAQDDEIDNGNGDEDDHDFAEITIAVDCPELENPTISNPVACSGSSISLEVTIMNDDSGVLTWYTQDGTVVADPSNVTLNETSCGATHSFYAIYTPATTTCTEIISIPVSVTVYPAIAATVSSSDCQVVLSDYCSNFNVSWADSNGGTGTGTTYIAQEGTAGTVTFTVTNVNGATGCESASFEGTYDCAEPIECPQIINPAVLPTTICSGEIFSLSAQIVNSDGGSIQWYDSNGTAVTDPSNLTASNTTCSPISVGYYAVYTPSNGDCPEVSSSVTNVVVYPAITAQANSGACSITLSSNCAYNISWSDDLGNTGSTGFYNAAQGTTGTVTFTLTNANAPENCNSASFEATFDCAAQVECPAIASLSCSPSVICSGGSFSLISQMANADGGNIQWYAENGVAVSDPNNLTLSNTTCSAYAAGYYAIYTPSNGDCEIVTSNLTYVTVYPEIIAEATNGTCSVSLTANCTYNVSWMDGSGNTGTGATYTAAQGTSGTVTFTVNNPDAPGTCNAATFSATFDCAAQVECPAIASLSCSPSVICSGGSFSLISQMANADGGNIQWYAENGVAVSDPNNLTLSNTTCSAYAAGYYAIYTPSNGDCEIVTSNLTYVTVYPEIIAEATNGTCSVSLTANCTYNVSWMDGSGNTGTGATYTAAQGTSGTVTFTVNNPDAPGTCNAATFSATFDCAAQVECPAIASLSCSPSVICSGGSFSLISQMANADGGNIQWYAENGVAVSDPNNLTLSNTTCSAYAAGYYAIYTPSNGDCEIVTSNLTYVTVYPEIIAEATNGTCSVSLTANCTYNVSWTDGSGNTGTGATYTAAQGTSGTVTFTVNNPNAPGTCNAATFSATYNCAAQVDCPAIASLSCSPSVICSGGSFSLISQMANADGGSIQWYAENGTAVSDPNNLTLSNTTCSAYAAGYYAIYTPSNGDCEIVTSNLTYVTVYPEIIAEATNGTCSVSLTANCTYNVSWTDGSGNTGTGATYTAAQGTAGTVTFTVNNPDAPGTCSAASFSANYNCPSAVECPTLGTPTVSTSVVCSGEIFSLSVGVNGMNDGSLTWYDQNGNTISDPSNVSVASADCNGTASSYYAVFVPTNAECSTSTSSIVNVTVYPELTGLINSTDCQVYLSNFCTNYNVVWTDDAGNTGNGATFNATPGQTGSVSFTITNPNVAGACSSNSFSGTFNCPSNPTECPILVNPACSPNVICEGESFNLTVGIDNPDGGTIQWFDADGNPLTSISDIIIDVEDCNGGQFGYYAQYMPSNSDCPTITSELAYVIVHPETTATVTSNECFVEIDNYCSTYNVGWTDSYGNTGTGDSYIAISGQSGTVTFTLSNPNAPSYCSQTTFVGTFNCPTNPVECNVSLDNPQIIPAIVCNGGVVALSVNVNSDVNGSLQWYDPNGNVVADPNNVVVSSAECGGATLGYYAIYTPTDSACTPVTSLTSLVQVYPSIAGNTIVSSDGCTVSMNTNCSNFSVVWQDNLGNTGSGSTYQAGPGQSGIVTYTVSNLTNGIPVECSAASFSESFNCPGNTACPSLTIPVAVPSVVCSGGSVSLTSTVNNPDGGTMQWYDTNGNAVNDPANAVVSTDDCSGAVVGFYSVYTSNNPNCTPVTSETTLVQVYPQVDAGFAISGIGCNVQVIDNCPNYVVTWFDNLGNSGTGTTYTATNGTSGNVTFTVTNPTMGAPATCASSTIMAPFDCFEDNPNIVCDTIQYCSEPVMPVLICDDFCGLTEPFTITEIDAVSGCVHEITSSSCVSYTPFALEGQEVLYITACNATECRTIVVKINIDDDCDNDSPLADDNTVDTNEDTAVVIDVLGNDSDPDGDALSICDSTPPLNGSIVLLNGLFTYTPNPGFVGIDLFTYTICDGNGGTADAVVYVNVAGAMTGLNANTDDFTVLNDEIVGIDVLLNDVYPDGCIPMIVIVSSPQEGFITVSNNGIINYEPQPGFIGDISFTYQICCGSDCDLTTVNLKVAGDKPCDGLRIPTGFSPNGDGTNERFTVDDLDECFADHRVVFKIFDRFGEAVYNNEDYKNTEAWDGESLQGNYVAEGTYFYIMSITKGESIIEKTGSIRIEY